MDIRLWVYGDSFKLSLVAVVVPNKEDAEKWVRQNGHKVSYSEVCNLTQLNEYILSELKSTAERNKVLIVLHLYAELIRFLLIFNNLVIRMLLQLRGFEHIKGVIVEPKTLEEQANLLTVTLKKQRDRMLKRYKEGIDSLFTRT